MRVLGINKGNTTLMTEQEYLRFMRGRRLYSLCLREYLEHRDVKRDGFTFNRGIFLKRVRVLTSYFKKPWDCEPVTESGRNMWGLVRYHVKKRKGKYYVTKKVPVF